MKPATIKPGSPVYIEVGSKRCFACSLEWPGLCRVSKTEEAALAALSDYVPRYTLVAARAGVRFAVAGEQPSGEHQWAVVERVATRSGGADFGVPTRVLDSDQAEVSAEESSRAALLLAASWELFDEVLASAPASLRKGPRGGGRDRDAIAAHVFAAEQMFAQKVGLTLAVPALADRQVLGANRAALLEWCRSGKALPAARPGWPPRYAARRLLWHVLDHAWEIEDRRDEVPGLPK